ncbi:thioredoxin chloroplastic [Raphidocelis subcapitata]|uniref:Thioredoxin chloroplastic n=1 Tax=Raphidocelis subcapitata TaxID=307507 RepID=A0A2V0PA42_9CHLO|nr:thioredoxin chloroplastic [Raphidocelis subcapitata]|eukprot:GBF94037.1 thioredoxin chloroplastic [Raphidocelis subcapitata]
MADTAAAAPAAARERLAADLRKLGAALSRKAQPGLAPEVQELVGSWDLRSRELLDAADGAEGGGMDGAAAAELLHPLLSGAFAAAHPGLFTLTAQAISSAVLLCCSTEASDFFLGPVAASLLDLFLGEQHSWQIHRAAAELLVTLLAQQDCAAWLLAAPSTESAVDALIAAAKREGAPQQDSAFAVLAGLAAADAATAERAASPEAALLPVAVERIRSLAAHPPPGSLGRSDFGPLHLFRALESAASGAVSTRARAAPGLAGAVADLLVALGFEEWAAAREERGAMFDQLEVDMLALLNGRLTVPVLYAPTYAALLSSRGALPRVLALLRSPSKRARAAASVCLAELACKDAGRDALFNVPRAASELAAALRRAHADGEDPALTQCRAAFLLLGLLRHSESRRVGAALARAAAAEGSGGSLLGALAGLIAAGVDDASASTELRQNMCLAGAAVLEQLLMFVTAAQLRVVQQVPRLAAACVRALHYWLTEAGGKQVNLVKHLVVVLAGLAGFDVVQLARWGNQPPAATADTAAARAALRGAPGIEGTLRRFLSQQPPDEDGPMESRWAAKWLLRLPEVNAAAAAAPKPAAAEVAAAAATVAAAAAEGAAAAAATAATAVATAAAAPAAAAATAAAGQRAVPQQPQPGAGGGGSSGSGSGASGSGAEAAARPRACGECGKSAAEAPLLRCVGCKAQHYCGDAVTEIQNWAQWETDVLASDKPVLVDIWATWCGPCKLVAPLMDWAEKEYGDKFKVVKVNHTPNPEVIAKYKVYGLPALMVFKGGELVADSHREGAVTKAILQKYVDEHILAPANA